MTVLTYNLDRLERCIFSLYDDIKTPEDILKNWSICEQWIENAWGKLNSGLSLLGGVPACRVRMLDVWNWELIVDPPLTNDCEPDWTRVTPDEIEYIKSGDDLCSFLLIFAVEGGDPNQFITDKWRYRP